MKSVRDIVTKAVTQTAKTVVGHDLLTVELCEEIGRIIDEAVASLEGGI
jgi:hypothetical protein